MKTFDFMTLFLDFFADNPMLYDNVVMHYVYVYVLSYIILAHK